MYTPPRPSVEKYTHRTTDRATADEGVGRAATDRSIDRCSGRAVPAVARAAEDDPTSRRHRATRGAKGTRARARDEEDVRARSRDDGRGRSRGGVGRRRENDGIGASETDAMRRPRAMIAARVWGGGSARWGNASTRANAGAR